MKLLDIAEVSEAIGIAPSALRYYEQQGLIQPVARHGLRRQYPPGVLMQLALIAMGKAAGFSLAEIGAMFGADGRPDLPRADLHIRADALERQAQQLEVLASALRHVADCPAPAHLECAKFQQLMRLSMKAGRRMKNGGQKAPA